ncbi:MAG TPA: PEGA domain-containing protein, partial [Kofleriaceae bacterium]
LEKRVEMRYPTMDEMMRAMADPVGFVESHGGIQGFMQRQLMPSTAPLPSIRLTPAPIMTPVPGHMTGGGHMMTPYPQTSSGYTGNMHGVTPVPTTLGAAAGEVSGKRSKVGFVIAGLVIVAAAVVGIVIVSSNKKDSQAVAPPVTVDAASPVAEPDAGFAAGLVDAAPIAIDAAVPAPDAATGSAGSASLTATTATVTITSNPTGARIFLDGKEQKQKTPADLTLPVGGKPVKIVLKLREHEDLALKPFVVEEDQKLLDNKLKRRTITIPTGKGSGKGSGGKGKGSDTDGLEKPE